MTNNEDIEKTVAALVALFAGPDVAKHSMALQVGGMMGAEAKRFFAARESLGIRGWDNEKAAEEAIRVALLLPTAVKAKARR